MTDLILFEQQIDTFIKQNNLFPADAIMVKKMPFKLLNHYILYLGSYQTRHVFMANTLSGVRIYNYSQLMEELKTFQPEKVERFFGNEQERREAVERALHRKDENSYHLILNNCQHLKNWVQKGIHHSEQVENIGKGTLAAGAIVALASAEGKSKTGVYLGLGLMLLGGLAWALSGSDKK